MNIKMGIRNFFKRFRKDDTVIDLANLQKRGIIKQKASIGKQSSGVLDLTKNSSQENPLSFLGALAGASSSNSDDTAETPTSAIFESEKKQKLNGLLRDMKSKIDNTYSKMYKLSDRIDLLEKKLERLERRAGVSDV